MEPFVIIRNYRQQRQAALEEVAPPRMFLRELDPNTLVSRQPAVKISHAYHEDDKENFNAMLELETGNELLKKIPSPNQATLIDYADYDCAF